MKKKRGGSVKKIDFSFNLHRIVNSPVNSMGFKEYVLAGE